MKKEYSANERLRNLTQNLGFQIFIFDDPSLGPEMKLRDKSKNQEIDAVLLYKNIFCLVGINKGKGKDVNKEIKHFFEKLDKVESVEQVKLHLDITKKKEKQIHNKEKIANALLKKISDHKHGLSGDYNMILRKVFFAPHRQIDDEFIRQYRNNDLIVIDKDIFKYFQEVLNRLDKRFLFNDFMHFLDIKKVDLKKKGTSKIKEPPRSSPFKVDRLELEKDKIIMYSLSLRVEDIIDYITVLRVARKYDKKGFQRMVKSTRLNKINNEYLSENETFPNNIIIALNPELYVEENDFYNSKNTKITFFDEYNSLIIIDGQHRFFSFVKGDKLNRYILSTLMFFKGGNKEENYLLMDKMFYKINKTQERIDPNLSFFLVAKIDPDSEENFWYNVFTRLDKKGFFAGRFSFKETTLKKGEPKKSIISVITYGGVLRLNKTYKIKGMEVDGLDTFYGTNREENINFAFNLMKNYFGIVEKVLFFQKIGKEKLSPREIGALLRFIKHFMISDKEKLKSLGADIDLPKSSVNKDKEIVEYFENILGCIPFGEVIGLEYPTSSWAVIEGYMLRKIHYTKPEFGNRNVLSKKGLEIYEKTIDKIS